MFAIVSDQFNKLPTSPAASSETHNFHAPLIAVPLKVAFISPSGLNVPVNGATPAVISVAADIEKQVLV